MIKDSKKAIISWSLYDWANSAFATTVMAGFFPVFFKSYWAGELSASDSTFYLGLINAIGSLIVAALAPFLGAIADRGGSRKKFLIFFAYLGAILTGCLYLISQNNWPMALLFYAISIIGFSGGNIFYDSLLMSVASPKKVDMVSSLGFSLGYIGGGLLFLVNVLMYKNPESFGIASGAEAVKLSFLTVGIWWAIFSIPIILFVKEEKPASALGVFKAVGAGWRQLKNTFRELKYLKVMALFLLAYWLYIDGVDTIIKMSIDYGTSLGFEASSLIVALLIVQFVAFPAALLYNLFAKKIGVKKALIIAIICYSIITVIGIFMTSVIHFYILAMCVGLFQGGIQALSRSFFSRMVPEKMAAEFYGFYNMMGKFGTVIGPLLLGIVTGITHNHRIGMASVLILFISGGILLSKVDIKEGERMAKEHLAK